MSFASPDGCWRVVVEDDDRVAYAYLREGDRIVGDVWLYNRAEAPKEPPWRKGPPTDPFLNPAELALEAAPIEDDGEVSVEWEFAEGVPSRVLVLVRGELVAILAPGAKPGWCRNAAKDGPLARVLSD